MIVNESMMDKLLIIICLPAEHTEWQLRNLGEWHEDSQSGGWWWPGEGARSQCSSEVMGRDASQFSFVHAGIPLYSLEHAASQEYV